MSKQIGIGLNRTHRAMIYSERALASTSMSEPERATPCTAATLLLQQIDMRAVCIKLSSAENSKEQTT